MISQRAFLGASILAAASLLGCSNSDPVPQTAGQKVDVAIDKAQDKLDDAKRAAAEAARVTGNALTDSTITAAVKTQLAADPDLRLLDIQVETDAGRARLQGTAPNIAARDRATQIASAVSGVNAVDNQLSVTP